MKRNAKYVALDVHQATTVASVREDSGRVIARTVLPTEAPALLEFFGGRVQSDARRGAAADGRGLASGERRGGDRRTRGAAPGDEARPARV